MNNSTFIFTFVWLVTDAILCFPRQCYLHVNTWFLDYSYHEIILFYPFVSHLEIPSVFEVKFSYYRDTFPIVNRLLEYSFLLIFITSEKGILVVDFQRAKSHLFLPYLRGIKQGGCIALFFIRPTRSHYINNSINCISFIYLMKIDNISLMFFPLSRDIIPIFWCYKIY